MNKVGLVQHPDFQKHDTGGAHPERPERLQTLHAHLDATGLTKDLITLDPGHVDTSWLEKAHTPEHIANVKARCTQGITYMDDFDTRICPLSFDIARLAVGATFEAIDAVMDARVHTAFCAVRTPRTPCRTQITPWDFVYSATRSLPRDIYKKHIPWSV